MRNNHKSIFPSLISILLAIIIFLVGKSFLDKKFDNNKITLEKESVQTIVSNFNSQIMNDMNSNILPINTEPYYDDTESYTYKINSNIILVIEPEHFSTDPNSDIAKFMYLQINVPSVLNDEETKYIKYLIKANNDTMSDNDITELLESAQDLKESYQTANIGTGIDFGIYEDEEVIQYQLTRILE